MSRAIRAPWDRPRPLRIIGRAWRDNGIYSYSGVANATKSGRLTPTGTYSGSGTVNTAAFFFGSAATTVMPTAVSKPLFTATEIGFNSPSLPYAATFSITLNSAAPPAASTFHPNNTWPIASLPFSGANRMSLIYTASRPTRVHKLQPSGYHTAGLGVGYYVHKVVAGHQTIRPGPMGSRYIYWVQAGAGNSEWADAGQAIASGQTAIATEFYSGRTHLCQIYSPASKWLVVKHYRFVPNSNKLSAAEHFTLEFGTPVNKQYLYPGVVFDPLPVTLTTDKVVHWDGET